MKKPKRKPTPGCALHAGYHPAKRYLTLLNDQEVPVIVAVCKGHKKALVG